MRERSIRTPLAMAAALLVLAHISLFFAAPSMAAQGIAVFVLTILLPGLSTVELLFSDRENSPTAAEHLLYSVGAGYVIAVVGMLLLSYLPGGLARWQTLLFFDLGNGLLFFLLLRRRRHLPAWVADTTPADTLQPDLFAQNNPFWIWVGLVVLVVVGGYFRFNALDYAEYQGDEARAALRAAAVIQGVEDVLLIHKKGPTEILLPTASYSLMGNLNETTARLPFAIANFVALFAVFLLGWRLFNLLSGWPAAMLFALDGYFIGFARIVQYQSIVFLMTVLVVLILYRLYRNPTQLFRYLTLAALLSATGLLSHYEAILVVLPGVILLGAVFLRGHLADIGGGSVDVQGGEERDPSLTLPRLGRGPYLGQPRYGSSPRLGEAGRGSSSPRPQNFHLTLLRSTFYAGTIGVVVLALFYIPFVRHPHFQATYTYLAERRIGGSFPYNNLSDFFLRTTIYTTSVVLLLIMVATVVAIGFVYGRGYGRRVGWITGLLAAAVPALAFRGEPLLRIGETDLTFLPYALILIPIVFLPRMRTEDRALWFWFIAGMLLALFFTEKPRTHVYTFFIPWLLIAAYGLSLLWKQCLRLIGEEAAVAVGSIAALLLILYSGNYAYWYFLHNQSEVLRTWHEWHPNGYWVPFEEPGNTALFGFPLANGWKVIGQLYAEGIISGDYETNEKEAWVPAWYTRGQFRCGRSADWFFEIDNLESWNNGDQMQMEHFLRHGFSKWGVVEVNGTPRLTIYKRTGIQSEMPSEEPIRGLTRYPLADAVAAFDRASSPHFPLTYPAIDAEIPYPLRANFDNRILLEGYDIEYEKPLQPNDAFRLTLFWRAQEPIWDSYKVFNQSFFGDGVMIAQRDGFPVCDTRETWRWDPGELITDVYDIPVNADAPDGLYPLYTGLYLEESFDRLHIFDADGNDIGSQVHLTDIRIGEE